MKYIPFNLNHNIKVKIKEEGYEYLAYESKQLLMGFEMVKPITAEAYKARADEDGYTTMQMHDFLDKFGKLGFTLCSYIDINILFVNQD